MRRYNFTFLFKFLATLTAAIWFTCFTPQSAQAGTTVTYTMQTGDMNASYFTSGGNCGWYNSDASSIGMYAHNDSPKDAAGWRDLKTAGDNSGSARSLHVGDVFSIRVFASAASGQIGFSLNAGGTEGSSYGNNISGSRLYVNADEVFGYWYVNRSGGNLTFGPQVSSTFHAYQFSARITSETTADLFMTSDGGSPYNAYNLTMNGSAGQNINEFSIYLSDDYNGSGNNDIYWGQTTSVQNSGVVQLGYYLSSGTFTPGLIHDGLDAASTSTSSPNSVYVGGNAGTAVVLNQANDYTGTSTINANATAILANNTGFGTASGGAVSVTSGGGIRLSNNVTVASTKSLTLNGSGASSGGALENWIGNNTWAGAISLGSSSTVASDSGTLTLSGNVDFQSQGYVLSVSGTANTTINGNFINVINGAAKVAKSGAGTLTISGNTSTSASHLMFNHSGGIISISSANAIAVPTDTTYPDKFNFLDNATLQVAANSFTLGNYTDSSHNCGFRIQGGKTGTFDVASGSTLTIDGQIIDVPSSGSGALAKISAGTLVWIRLIRIAAAPRSAPGHCWSIIRLVRARAVERSRSVRAAHWVATAAPVVRLRSVQVPAAHFRPAVPASARLAH